MKRLLFVSHKPTFGGPENQALRLSKPLEERGWHTTVAVTAEPGTSGARLRGANIDVVTLQLHRLRAGISDNVQMLTSSPGEVIALARLINRLAIDLVLVPGLENPHAVVAARLTRKPLVWQVLGSRTPMAFRRAMLGALRGFADAAMITGTTLIQEHPGLEALGPRLVPFFPPVDTSLFAPDEARMARVRKELGFDRHDVVIGSVANLNAQKDHLTFVRAAAEVRRLAPHASTRFLMLGEESASQSSYVSSIWREVASLGLVAGRDVVHVEPKERVVELASALDIFWLTSEQRSEGVPTAMLEAMSLGTPVVATRVGGVEDILVDGEAGAIVDAKDFRSIAARTLLLVADASLRRQFGQNGRAKILKDASLGRCVEAHIRAFDVAINHRQTTRWRGRASKLV